MYFLHLKSGSANTGSIDSSETQSISLQMQGQERENEQYFVTLQSSQDEGQLHLQLHTDPEVVPTTFSNTADIQHFFEIIPNIQQQQIDNQTISKETLNETVPVVSYPTLTVYNKNKVKTEENKKYIQNFFHIADRLAVPHAVAVLPSALKIRRDIISPRRPLPACTRFGPVKGVDHIISQIEANDLVVRANTSKTPIFLITNPLDDSFTYIDVSDKDKSNWFSLLPLGDKNTANVFIYEENNALYGITIMPLATRTPLAIGYSKDYAETYGLPDGQILHFDAEESVKSNQWWCSECHRALPSAAMLQRHNDVYHKEYNPKSRRRYRCRHCTRTFATLFTLKRHAIWSCTKKSVKIAKQSTLEVTSDLPEETSQTVVDKLPSDESLQNYTNNLDFSTNLFDTDRMPNLDISGSSRSETDFNPFAINYKDDNGIASDSTNGCNSSYNNLIENNPKIENILFTCPYCNETLVRENNQKHLRECPGRRKECECGRVFKSKDSLAKHIYLKHPPGNAQKMGSNDSEETPYKCEECQLIFKRRGMLVNHLLRIHKTSSVSVPLERRIRHYPCVACPKMYNTAAKRDVHVRTHHPGSESLRAQSIEGGKRVCEPAACPGCPRQYATRAKMLQHVRATHPQLCPIFRHCCKCGNTYNTAPPVKKKTSMKATVENTQPKESVQTPVQHLVAAFY